MPSAPAPSIALPELSDLDRAELDTATAEKARRTRRAILSVAAARAYGSGCASPDASSPTLLEARFQVEATRDALVVRSPVLSVRKGAPLSADVTACLLRAFRNPISVPAPSGAFLSGFSGSGRVEIGIGDCSRL